MRLAINARFTGQPQGGQQRVGSEISRRLSGNPLMIAPGRPLDGLKGHAWEQAVLPLRAAGTLLWSPSATGPVSHKNQVVTLHDVAFIDHPEFFSPQFVRLYRLLMPALLSRAAHVVTVSDFSRARIIAHYGLDPSKVTTIYNGVGETFRQFTAAEIAATREALQLPERYLLLQATADRRKNLSRALSAWGAVTATVDPDISLVVTGRVAGSRVFGAGDALPEPPRTRYLGFVPDEQLGPLTAGALGFLFPSLYEGFGLPIIEAFACGAPVITGNTSAMPEIAGDAALLVDPTSERAIAEAMLSLISDATLRTQLIERGLERVTRFSWDKAASQYQALFDALA